MSWLLPTMAAIPAGGQIRSAGRFDRTTYDRAYYHAKRKGRRRQTYTPEQKTRRALKARERYEARRTHLQALARSYYWKHREKRLPVARENARRQRQRRTHQEKS